MTAAKEKTCLRAQKLPRRRDAHKAWHLLEQKCSKKAAVVGEKNVEAVIV